ncbi:hypothetical protein, partial [Salmonella enterica]|uniref:hypothetical protein n=1 Tax=Salmonella enterica TaxID=28901 RepID=UPI001A7E7D8B
MAVAFLNEKVVLVSTSNDKKHSRVIPAMVHPTDVPLKSHFPFLFTWEGHTKQTARQIDRLDIN